MNILTLREYHYRYEWRDRCVQDVRQGVFHPIRFAAPQGTLLLLTPQDSLVGWVRRWYRYHPLPAELGMRLAPHPAQAARLKFKVSDCAPLDRYSRVTFTQV